MKGNLTIKLIGVLVVVIGIYAVVKFTDGKSRSKSYHETLVDIDTAAVTKIEIENAGNQTVLKKTDGKWTVENGKSATSSSVKSLLGNLLTIKPSRLASRKEESWKDFQVDSAGTNVKIYEGSDKTLDLVIGRFGVEGQRSFYTHVRLADEEDTYVANNFMGMGVGKSAADFRNSQILKVKKDSISSIDFAYVDGTFSLEKGGNDQWTMGGVPADSASVASYLSGLTFVSSKNFSESPLPNAAKTVVIHLKGSDEVTLASDGVSIIKSTQNEGEIFQDQAVYDKIFKSPTDFVKE